MIKAVLFDFDGTIINTLPFYLKAFKQQFNKYGIKVTNKKIASDCFGVVGGAKNLGISDNNINNFYTGVQNYISVNKPKLKPFAQVKNTLNSLQKNNYKLAIVSTSNKQTINKLLNANDLTKYFSVIISSDMVANQKPHKEPVLKALKLLKVKPKMAVLVGDSSKDILAAKNAGVKSICFYPKQHKIFYSKASLKSLNPDYFVDQFGQVLQIVL